MDWEQQTTLKKRIYLLESAIEDLRYELERLRDVVCEEDVCSIDATLSRVDSITSPQARHDQD